MFHVFQSQHQANARPTSKRPSKKIQERQIERPVKIPHACTECKRRKIRCDGGHPCGKCISRDVGSACTYARQRERLHPSKKKLDGLSRALEEHRTIVDRLFPEHEVADLLSLTRHDLIDILILSDTKSTPSMSSNSWLVSDHESVSTGTSWLPSPPPDLTSFDFQDTPAFDYQKPETNPFMINSTQQAFDSNVVNVACNWLGDSDESLLQNTQYVRTQGWD